MKIIDKFKNFFRRKSPTVQEMFDFNRPRYQEKQEGNILDSPFVSQIAKPFYRFWLKRWTILLPVIVALLGIAVMLFKT